MTSNNAESNQCNEPTPTHRGILDQLHEQVDPRGVWFETYELTENRWIPVVVGTNRTEASLRQQYGPIRHLTELVARKDIEEVLTDAD